MDKEYNNGDYYCNYYQSNDKEIILVAGGGMGNGNAYANVENRDGKYFYCEYGANPVEKYIGNKIIYDDPGYKFNFRVVDE